MSEFLDKHTLSEINELILTAKSESNIELTDLLSQVGHNVEVVKDEIRRTTPATLEAVKNTTDAEMILLQAFDKLDNKGKLAVIRSGISAKTKKAEDQITLMEKHEAMKLRSWIARVGMSGGIVIIVITLLVLAFTPSSSNGVSVVGSGLASMFDFMKLIFGNPV